MVISVDAKKHLIKFNSLFSENHKMLRETADNLSNWKNTLEEKYIKEKTPPKLSQRSNEIPVNITSDIFFH